MSRNATIFFVCLNQIVSLIEMYSSSNSNGKNYGRLANEEKERFAGIIHSQTMKPSMTLARPTLISATSLPPLAVPLVGDAEGEPVWEPVGVDVVVEVGADLSRLWPRVGSAGFPLITHCPGVDVGHEGVERLDAEAE